MKVSSGILWALLFDGKAKGRKYKYKIDGVYKNGRHLYGVFRCRLDGLDTWACIGYLNF